MGDVAEALKHHHPRRDRFGRRSVLAPLVPLVAPEAAVPIVLGDDELDDLVSAAYVALKATQSAPRAERVAELLRLLHRLRGPLEQLQVELSERLRRRPDDFSATDALRIVNDALAATRHHPSPVAAPKRRRLRRKAFR